MNFEQMEQLRKLKPVETHLQVDDISAPNDRTLLYGYTCVRDTFHVYYRNGLLERVIYDYNRRILSHIQSSVSLPMADLIPDKRLYPETCDFVACSILAKHGFSLPFTTYNHQREPRQFYGQVVSFGQLKEIWFEGSND